MKLSDIQQYMREERIGGWLVYDFRGSNATFARLLPLPAGHATGRRFTTRRAALWIPANGEPALLSHWIDRGSFEGATLLGGHALKIQEYLTWQDLHAWIRAMAGDCQGSVAMEYSAGCALPVVSVVDAGTVELVRSAGAEVVSSANLIQVCVARWNEVAVESHEWASREVARVKDEAFAFMRARLATGDRVSEYDVHQLIHALFKKAGLETPDGPVVAVNGHGADPHFEVSATHPATIRKGDWILLDLWARRPGDQHIFSDITWVAFAGDRVPERHQKVFDVVKRGRDAAVELAQKRWAAKQGCEGWELDDATRNVIVNAGYGQYIKHRTGHSLSAGPLVHGAGVNIDNLETHDRRAILPGVGFTVEPGVYVPDGPDGSGFGVRLEINVYADPVKGPRVTSCVQNEVVLV